MVLEMTVTLDADGRESQEPEYDEQKSGEGSITREKIPQTSGSDVPHTRNLDSDWWMKPSNPAHVIHRFVRKKGRQHRPTR